MPVKEKLSGISLYTLIPLKNIERRITIKDEPLLSTPFIIPKNRIINSRFTGRIKELDYLRTLYSEVIARIKRQTSSKEIQSKPIIAAIKGDAGIGKTRLVKEFTDRIISTNESKLNNIIYGSSLSTGQNSYGMFSEILKTQSQKIKSKPDNESNTAINNFIKEVLFREAFIFNKQNIPYIVMLEDMQWADESSLSALEHIVRSINLFSGNAQPQIFFILNYRSGFKPRKALRTEGDYREILLSGFTEGETEKLIADLTCGSEITGKIKEIITRRSDGNPFNIEEWCTLILDNKKLSQIPETVKHLLVEKVENLTPEERSVLIIASVLGRKFELKILRDIQMRAGKELATPQVMRSLIEKRFLVNLTGDIYEFRHDILQETIYKYLKTGLKENVHLLAGNAIEELYPNKLSDYYYELARHYTAAKNESKSIEYLEKAGDKAKDNYEYKKAIHFYEMLLNNQSIYLNRVSLLDKLFSLYKDTGKWNKALIIYSTYFKKRNISDDNIDLVFKISEIHYLLNDFKIAYNLQMKIIKFINATKNTCYLSKVYGNLGRIFQKTSKFNKAISYYNLQLKSALKFNDSNEIAKAHDNLGVIKRLKGNYHSAKIHYEQSISHYAHLANKQMMANITDKLGTIYYYLGDYVNAKLNYESALNIYKKTGSIYGYQNTLGNMGILLSTVGDNKKAKSIFAERIKLCNNINDLQGFANTFFAIGNIYLNENNFPQALKYFSKSERLYLKLKNKQCLSKVYSNLGLLYQSVKKYEKAEIYFIEQLKTDKRINNIEGLMRGYVNIGNNMNFLNFYNEAINYYKKTIKLGKINHINQTYATALYNISEVYCKLEYFKKASLTICKTLEISNKFNLQIEKEKILNLKRKYSFKLT